MKVVILAGGLGTRISEETSIRPKPMVEIGDEPILWHIMKIYSTQGFSDFIICAGYKQHMIKDYFVNYLHNHVDMEVDLSKKTTRVLSEHSENWKVTIVDTGKFTMTGGRIKKISKYIGNETFMLTYGDGLSDVNLNSLLKSHHTSGAYVTVTAVQPKGRFGSLVIDDSGRVIKFQEKLPGDGFWVNGGYYVMEPEIFDYIGGEQTVWEGKPMSQLAMEGKLNSYKHLGFWRPMDTMTDKRQLELMWNNGDAPWKIWGD
ncbi:MAG: glucose-1-phosphate cytidylyltransferase [Thermoplasmatales archaeon B_DKE]|nr:MAG: glucose-1-phosphate cytidylyltransferase [Thermoplasmatales archaeon B_DKE]